jgi:hypothetical protein
MLVPTVEHIKQDAWVKENSFEPPIAVLMFVFTSKGGFFSNNPIHVKIQMWLTVGENYSDIAICFPDAYAYPMNQTLGKPPSAGWVQVIKENNFTGEGDIIFTSSGSFGYIIFSEEKPVYYAAEQHIIQISPHESLLQMKFAIYSVGVTLISIGVSVLALPKIRTAKKGKTQKTRKKRIKLNFLLFLWCFNV